MVSRTLRAAIVGASSLVGRELAEQMNDSTGAVWDLTLLDSDEASGQVTGAGDEPMLIQPLTPGAFERMDVVFFAGDTATARTHWKEAQAAGVGVVDLTGGLVDQAGSVVLAPAVGGAVVDLTTTVVVPAHSAVVMLALVETRLRAKFGAVKLLATVMEPASEQGKAGLDELHQQTVGLLSFQAVPKDVYDVQVAFNVSAALGAEARTPLEHTAGRIRREFAAVSGGGELALQLVQTPVFNGYTASVYVELAGDPGEREVREALHGGIVNALEVDEPGPSSLNALSQKDVLMAVRKDAGGYWVWMAADNLLLAADNAIKCAVELARLRPAGKVQ